ncbi:MAG: phage holin family protein [Halofilum sp. (in: g-proteobacteria)]
MEQPTRDPEVDVGGERARLDRPASLSSLLSDLMRQTADLVHNETALARTEISQKISQVESGGVQLLVAAVLGIAGAGALVASAILGLSLWLAPWLSALIVGAVIAVVALIFLAVGRSKLRADNLPPQATTDNIRKDAGMLRGHAQ